MKFIFVLLLAFSSLSFASVDSCGEKLGKIVNAKAQTLVVDQRTYSFAVEALRHYRQTTNPTSKVYIEKFVRYVDGGRRTGYKVDITDGGDESKISYYFNRDGGLVYAKWHNQSPVEYWLCK